MNITKKSELVALHRAIVEAKFKQSHMDTAIPYSGIISDLSLRIVADIIQKFEEDGEQDEVEGWLSISKLNEDWYGYQCIKMWITETQSWINMDLETKSQFISVLCAPYLPSTQQEEDLIKFGDKHWKI